MANHLTPTELAREAGMDRREVIDKCMEMGVPIFQGRIDKTLFLASLKQIQTAGGKVLTPRTDIGPNMGAFAAFADPVGNEFGLYEEPQS